VGGASHGALLAGDSLGPLVLCGIDSEIEPRRQWALRDVAGLVTDHFGVADDVHAPPSGAARVAG